MNSIDVKFDRFDATAVVSWPIERRTEKAFLVKTPGGALGIPA